MTLARLHWVTQREYLDAISDEHEAYAYNPLRAQVSLIEASREKFSGAAYSDLVYRKGALAAALYDLELRWQSRGGRNVLDVMRALYRDYALRSRAIGNREVLDALRQAGNFGDLIHNDIETARGIGYRCREEDVEESVVQLRIARNAFAWPNSA